SGGAILSRFPIQENETILLPKPDTFSWLYNLFYLFRYIQKVTVEINGQAWTLLNSHLEAFDTSTRMAHASVLFQTASQHAHSGDISLLAFGGDMNSVPSNSKNKSGYADEPKDDYRNDETYRILSASSEWKEMISP